MRVTGHQPVYLPYLGTVHKIAVSERFILWDDVPQESSGYENRVRVKGANGPQWLTVPVRRDREALLRDVRICTDQNWPRKHYRALELSYGRAPYWPTFATDIKTILDGRHELLADLDLALLRYILKVLGIERPITRLSCLGLTSHKSQLVLDVTLAVGGSEYLFGRKGRDYADVPAFNAAGVKPLFQSGDFPDVSTLDALFTLGPDETFGLMMARGRVEE